MDRGQWKRQRERWKDKLEGWHTPQDFHDALQTLRAEYGKQLLFKAEFTGLFRDAFAAIAFALHRGATQVRLIGADRPDFEVDLGGRRQMYEVVEADTPGRRRGDEYKYHSEPATGTALPDDFYLAAELAPQILASAAKRKDKGVYQSEWGLVIVLNPAQPGGREQRRIEKDMPQATAAAGQRFAEVWVLWERTAYSVWHHGKPGSTVLQPATLQDMGDRATAS